MINDLSKYKRVFTFGCSFTMYCCPTWADLLFLEMPNAEHYNFGEGGSGNTLISNRIVQANLKYKFCETDLVLVLYTSPLREDRYIDGRWRPQGNVFNQHYYDKNFVKNYCDPIGLLLKDAGTIALSKQYVDNLPCDTFQMLADGIHNDLTMLPAMSSNERQMIDKIISLFSDVFASFPITRIPCNNIGFNLRIGSTVRWDSHPNPNEHLKFMKDIGLPTGPASELYAQKATEYILAEPRTHEELAEYFPEFNARILFRDRELI